MFCFRANQIVQNQPIKLDLTTPGYSKRPSAVESMMKYLLVVTHLLVGSPVAAWRPTVCKLTSGEVACVVTPPTPCPVNPLLAGSPRAGERFNCSIVDLRIAVSANDENPGRVPEYGLFVRFFVPTTNAKSIPLLLSFHGTGGCGFDGPASKATCTCSPDIPCSLGDSCKKFQVASEGVLVASPAERGTSHCYAPEDLMSASATWLGNLEWRDYDTLVDAVIAGTLPHLPGPDRVDAARVGVTGGSHGGLASFIYPRHARAASLLTNGATHLFALSMPWEGTPDVGDTWNRWEFDADTLAATGGRPRSAGFIAGAGAISQLHAWPKSTLARTMGAAVASGNFTPLVSFLATRTAYDSPTTNPAAVNRSLSIFHHNVAVLLVHQGGRDCIVPGWVRYACVGGGDTGVCGMVGVRDGVSW